MRLSSDSPSRSLAQGAGGKTAPRHWHSGPVSTKVGATGQKIRKRTMTNRTRHHIVIGDGGTAAAFAEMSRLNPGDRLSVIAHAPEALGRGLAYGDHAPDAPWRYAYLLNSPSAAVLPDFADWLRDHWPHVSHAMQGRHPDWLGFGADHIEAGDLAALFAPRAFFGDYLSQMVETALARHQRNGVTLNRIKAGVRAIDHDGTRFRVTLDDGRIETADSVDLAPGTPAMDAFCTDAGPGAFPMLYGREDAIAARLKPGNRVICLGANAAMLDVLRFLQSLLAERDISMTVISASGLRPEPLIWDRPRKPDVAPRITGPFATCDDFLAAVDSEIARMRRDEGAGMSQLRPGFKNWATSDKLAELLPDPAERRRVTHPLERRFRRGTHDSIADFHRLLAAGQITEIIARARQVTPAATGARVHLTTHDGADMQLDAPLVINCAGPGARLALDPPSEDLVSRGWLAMAPDGAGLMTGPGLRIGPPGLRYLAPTVIEVGDKVSPFPLFDMGGLRQQVALANGIT